MKPIILITNRFDPDPLPFGVGRIYSIRSNYCRAIQRAGGTPVISALGDAQAYAQMADGILFTGSSSDISPSRYGQELLGSEGCDPEMDEMELALFQEFQRAGKPILGICRGIQLINVALGGTLCQDVPTQVPGLTAHRAVYDKKTEYHKVYAQDGSLFYSLFGREFTTNSYHHQAVAELGQGMRATVRSEDGVIEAIEHTTLPIFAAQWHPERMIGDEQTELPNMLPMFRHFVQLCAGYQE